jgi:hypothetical protein
MLVDTTEMPPKFSSFSFGYWLRFSDILGCLWIPECYTRTPAREEPEENEVTRERLEMKTSEEYLRSEESTQERQN